MSYLIFVFLGSYILCHDAKARNATVGSYTGDEKNTKHKGDFTNPQKETWWSDFLKGSSLHCPRHRCVSIQCISVQWRGQEAFTQRTAVPWWKSICWFPPGVVLSPQGLIVKQAKEHTRTGLPPLPLHHMQIACALHHGTRPCGK